tara:strand:+ start:47181 stop:47483 length:303 start_codon:yes stop_codon:yes gene_type:complete
MADHYLIEEIIAKLSLKYNLPKTAIRAICESPFRLLSDNVRNKTLKGVNFKHLGKFAVHENYKAKVKADPEGDKLKSTLYIEELKKVKIKNAYKPNKTDT